MRTFLADEALLAFRFSEVPVNNSEKDDEKMFFFNKKKEEPPTAAAPVKKDIPLPPPAKPADADDFFKDMGRRPRKAGFEIDLPDITGLREEPLPPPGSTIRNAKEVSTDGLKDKSGFDDSFIHGDIRTVRTETLDVDMGLDKYIIERDAHRAAKAAQRNSADEFFADIDSRKRIKPDLDVPEVTGLREEPAPPPIIGIQDAAQVSTDGLRDKSGFDSSFIHGNISGVDSNSIDTSVLDRK